MKCRSRVPGHRACLKRMSSTITLQVFILPAITAAEKSTLIRIVDRQTVGWMDGCSNVCLSYAKENRHISIENTKISVR